MNNVVWTAAKFSSNYIHDTLRAWGTAKTNECELLCMCLGQYVFRWLCNLYMYKPQSYLTHLLKQVLARFGKIRDQGKSTLSLKGIKYNHNTSLRAHFKKW